MRRLVLLALLALSAPATLAQKTGDAPRQRVTLSDGRTFVGVVTENGDGTVTIVDASGVRTVVPEEQIARVEDGLP